MLIINQKLMGTTIVIKETNKKAKIHGVISTETEEKILFLLLDEEGSFLIIPSHQVEVV